MPLPSEYQVIARAGDRQWFAENRGRFHRLRLSLQGEHESAPHRLLLTDDEGRRLPGSVWRMAVQSRGGDLGHAAVMVPFEGCGEVLTAALYDLATKKDEATAESLEAHAAFMRRPRLVIDNGTRPPLFMSKGGTAA